MHLKPAASSAVDELHKLTNYNSDHQRRIQIHFYFLGKIQNPNKYINTLYAVVDVWWKYGGCTLM